MSDEYKPKTRKEVVEQLRCMRDWAIDNAEDSTDWDDAQAALAFAEKCNDLAERFACAWAESDEPIGASGPYRGSK